jgi:hypothetical protein
MFSTIKIEDSINELKNCHLLPEQFYWKKHLLRLAEYLKGNSEFGESDILKQFIIRADEEIGYSGHFISEFYIQLKYAGQLEGVDIPKKKLEEALNNIKSSLKEIQDTIVENKGIISYISNPVLKTFHDFLNVQKNEGKISGDIAFKLYIDSIVHASGEWDNKLSIINLLLNYLSFIDGSLNNLEEKKPLKINHNEYRRRQAIKALLITVDHISTTEFRDRELAEFLSIFLREEDKDEPNIEDYHIARERKTLIDDGLITPSLKHLRKLLAVNM